jgi:dephospho-CoA kinase
MASAKNKFLLGVTGGIGSGKSTVLAMLGKKGAATVDADFIVHSLYESDEPLKAALVRNFGQDVVDDNGVVNRKALADIVFNSDRDRKRLEEMIHPRVRRRIKAEMQESPKLIVAVDIPLLYESYWQSEFDAVVVVNANDESRLLRLAKKGITRIEARKRMAAQLPLSVKIRKADYVINNDGPLSETKRQVDRLWTRLSDAQHGG